MRRVAGGAAILAVLLGVPLGCAHDVRGVARPATTAERLLPSEDEMSAAVGNRLNTFGFLPFVGGLEIMPDGFRTERDAEPIGCVGVTDTMTRRTYEPADVIEAARQSYFNPNEGVDISGADAAVVRLASPGAATDTFDSFARQWRECDGTTVVKHLRGVTGLDVDATVTEVRRAGDILTATVITRQGDNAPALRYGRAVARRDNTIAEISLALPRVGAVARHDDGGQATRAVQTIVGKAGD